jgi:hypothetical protein
MYKTYKYCPKFARYLAAERPSTELEWAAIEWQVISK